MNCMRLDEYMRRRIHVKNKTSEFRTDARRHPGFICLSHFRNRNDKQAIAPRKKRRHCTQSGLLIFGSGNVLRGLCAGPTDSSFLVRAAAACAAYLLCLDAVVRQLRYRVKTAFEAL